MKYNNIRLTLLLAAFALLASPSCTREDLPDSPMKVGQEQEGVPVSLSLSVAGMEAGTPETKTVLEPDNGTSSDDQIDNFLLLQFDGTSAGAKIVGGQAYFDHYPLTPADAVLLKPSDTPNTLVVLANTFGRLGIEDTMTLGAFLEGEYSKIAAYSGVFTRKGDNDYLRMSGSLVLDEITVGTPVALSLKRNVSKLILHVANNTSGSEKVTLEAVQLKDINAKYYYLAHVGAGLPLQFKDPYTDAYPMRIDKDQEAFTDDGTTQTFTYYVPANLRGTTTNTYQYAKGKDAPAGATCFQLFGTYGDDDTPITYTYYLGGNLTNDFDLKPNYSYTYDITLSTKGDDHYDYRVDDMKEVRFQTDANSYMLHPPKVAGQSRVYAIPVRRAATFWNPEGVNGGVYGASQQQPGYESCVMDANTAWTAEILWSDFALTPDDFLIDNSGVGFDPMQPSHADPYFRVKVAAGMKGNVVVGVKKGDTILWSWHLWITDYDPDQHYAPESGKYIYSVPGGEIHRYNSDIWKKEPTPDVVGYAKGFAMDRSLGSSGTTYEESLKGVLFQFGRKDPFNCFNQNANNNRIYLGGTDYQSPVAGTRLVSFMDTGQENLSNTCYAVTHPMVFISGDLVNGCWTGIEDKLGDNTNSSSIYWSDKKFYQHRGDQNILEENKSIYDPCPPGWKVPAYGTWNDWTDADSLSVMTGTYTSIYDGDAFGRYYYPEGYVNRQNTGGIFYPFTLYYSNDGSFRGGECMYWMSRSWDINCGYAIRFSSMHIISYSSVNVEYKYRRSLALSVRCVRE